MSLTRSEVDTIQDEHSAARAWLELEHERNQPGLPHGRVTENRAATERLEQTWPQAPDTAARAADHELGGLPPALRRTRDQHRRNAGVTARQAQHARRARAPRSPAASRPASQSAKPSKRRPGAARVPKVPRVVRDAGDYVAPVGMSYGQMGVQIFGWGIGLSLLYLLLSPRGTGAVTLLSHGISNTLAAVVNPLIDPLSPTTHAQPAAATQPDAGQPAAGQPATAGQPAAPTSGAGALGAPNVGGFPRASAPRVVLAPSTVPGQMRPT